MDTKNTPAAKQAKEIKKDAENFVNDAENKAEELKTKVSENLSNISENVSEKIDAGQKSAVEKAHSLGDFVQQQVDSASKLGHRAVEAISGSTDYIKNFDVDKARESVKVSIKEQPELTLVAVGILGLIVGYLVGKRAIK